MIFGVLIGTYSSVFVAAPALILLGSVRDTRQPAKASP
jgi:preprotein translocase subunit SecF